MNWDKFKFGALLIVLSICVLAAGWAMRLKGSDAQSSDTFKVIPYSIETHTPWASEHPYLTSYDEEEEYDDEYEEDGDDEFEEDEDEHPKNEHPSSASYWDSGE